MKLKWKCFIRYWMIGAIVFVMGIGKSAAMEPRLSDLRCENLKDPMGLDDTHPTFSWKLSGNGGRWQQGAYRILVATSRELLTGEKADGWNSGRVNGDQSVWVRYEGKALKSSCRYYWKVYAWSDDGKDSTVSDIASFATGLMKPEDWAAKWIGLDAAFSWDDPQNFHSRLSARYFRKTFSLPETRVVRATAYLVGLGLYEISVNGKQAGSQVLAPSVSDYSKRVYYNTFDVTDKLLQNDNTIGIVLGNGRFFSSRPGRVGAVKGDIPSTADFGYPKLLFQLEIEYGDGTKKTIVSDSSWKVTADGPIRSNSEYDGETYDARKELTGWDRSSFNASGWLPVSMTVPPKGKICWQANPNMKIMKTLTPVSIKKNRSGNFMVDMGQNMVGWVRLHVSGKKGDQAVMRFAERLNDDGSLYTDNLRSAKVTDSYVLSGKTGGENWEPAFTYHGFQYVEVSGVPSLSVGDVTGKVVYDEMEATGDFTCSDPLLNKIFKNAWWTICGNYKGMPADCPQRDERMGWMGDRSINCFGESFIFGNYHLYAKWLDDIKDAQTDEGSIPDIVPAYWRFYSDNMTWPSTYLFVAQMLYEQYGDREVLKRHYPYMKKWMVYMQKYLTKDFLLNKDSYGDWCMPPESQELIFSKDSTRITPGDYIASAYYFYCLKQMEKFASVLSMSEDEHTFRNLSLRVLTATNQKYFNAKECFYANNTVTANLLAVSFNMVPTAYTKRVMDNIAMKIGQFNNHLSTGLVGNQWLMRGLSNNGYSDIAYTIATNTSYPSWGYMISKGASTIWELWNGNTANPAMNSGNHVMLLGDLLIWYYENLAGIRSVAPGFKKIEMKPFFPEKLSFVKASHKSPYGEIKSEWKRDVRAISWKVTIPDNSSAVIYLPSARKEQITETGKPLANRSRVKFIEYKDGYAVYAIAPGSYSFLVPTP
jgi:alpha-L-rhamnosidase